MAHNFSGKTSLLLVEEYFDQQDSRFLDSLWEVNEIERLAGFADRWKKDPRPWAREQMIEYVKRPFNRIGHQPLTKRLFKQAEENRDVELMALFMVAFDSLVRYRRKSRWLYNWDARESYQEEYLMLPRNKTPLIPYMEYKGWSGQITRISVYPSETDRHFSNRTRYYLRRRAWRYFRRLGHDQPQQYPELVSKALVEYTDDHFETGEAILQSWGMLHACFHHSPVLEFSGTHAYLKEGALLEQLEPAPYYPALWQDESSFEVLFHLVTQAKSRLMRLWGQNMLRSHHTEHLQTLSLLQMKNLLGNADEEVVQFGAECFRNWKSLSSLSIQDWLKLLEIENIGALEIICETMNSHVVPDRLSLEETVSLATATQVPVSRLGIDWLKARKIVSEADREVLSNTCNTKCVATATELTTYILSQIGTPTNYNRDQVLGFFDSLTIGCREGAWNWLKQSHSPGWDDVSLWTRLLETPYDDLRLSLIDTLDQRSKLFSSAKEHSKEHLIHLWCSVLSGVHRGSRQKLRAIKQMKEKLKREPQLGSELIPVLVLAVRSIRAPESTSALSALVELANENESLREHIQQSLPELKL